MLVESMNTAVVKLHRWDEIALEKVTEMLSRKIVTGERDHLREDCEALAMAVPGLELVVVSGAAPAPMTMAANVTYTIATPNPRGIQTRVSPRTSGVKRNAIRAAMRKSKSTLRAAPDTTRSRSSTTTDDTTNKERGELYAEHEIPGQPEP